MPFFIPASIIIPALAKTTAEVSGWLILEYCTVGSVSTVGALYCGGVLNKSTRFAPLQVDETPLHQASLSIQDAMLRTNESILRLCEILGEVKGYTEQISADDKITDAVCQNIRLHLKDIGTNMDLIRQLFQEFKQDSSHDNEVFSGLMEKLQSLEKTLNEVKSQSLEKIQGLEEELEAKDTTIRKFFELNQLLNERISSLSQATSLSSR